MILSYNIELKMPNQQFSDVRVSNVAIIVLYNTDTLLMRKSYGKCDWVSPGGHIDGDETPLMAAKRELYEETGIKGSPLKYIGNIYYTNRKKKWSTACYTVKLQKKPVIKSQQKYKEHTQYEWINLSYMFDMVTTTCKRQNPKERIKKMNITDNDSILYKIFYTDGLSPYSYSSFKLLYNRMEH